MIATAGRPVPVFCDKHLSYDAADATWMTNGVGKVFAIATGGKPSEIAKAQSELAKAADDIADGKYDKAIDHYKKAWSHAIKAVKDARFLAVGTLGFLGIGDRQGPLLRARRR